MIALQSFDAGGAVFTDANGRAQVLSATDLLAIADQGRNPRSGQRVPGFLRDRGALIACAPAGAGWRIEFADGSMITVPAAAITADQPAVPRRVWRADDLPPPVHDYRAVMDDDTARLACLRQVLSHGYARIVGAPVVPGTVLDFITSFGPVRETNYGRWFDVRMMPDPANLADSTLALLPHTDNPYRASPPDLQVLHALTVPAQGGETWLVDGAAVVDHLRASAPAALAVLTDVPVRFGWSDSQCHLLHTAPVITLDPSGALLRMRVNSRSLDRPVEPDPARRAAWWSAWALLESCLADRRCAQTFALDAGEMVVMDNARVLHGRGAFAGAGHGEIDGQRHLQGAYADRDGLCSAVFTLARARADADVAALGKLFTGAAMDDDYGEAISIRDHMLQSAELASARDLGEPMVAAALLHDIGWGLGAPHEQTGADRLEPVFGAAVADPVRWHVAAKRYLVAQRPDYHACLSAASVATLRAQGGAMDGVQCAQFEAHAGHADALSLRLIDDAGKVLDPPRTGWRDYLPLLRRLALRHQLGG